MVVDDDKSILLLLDNLLKPFESQRIEYHRSPHAALNAFEACPGKYQFVVMDLEMPGMSGIELCRRFWRLAPALKILLMTGSGIITAGEADEIGFCGLLAKPFRFAAIRNAIVSAGILSVSQKNFAQPMALTTA